MQVYLNGEHVEREHAAISVEDRGFLFGDGVYEVVRALGGRLIEAQRHWRRLARSLNGILIERPAELDDDALFAIAYHLLEANDLTESDALLYVQVTRGAAVRTHHFPAATTRPTVFASVSAFQPPDALRARGAAVITMPDIRWARCDIKSVNLLPNVLAKQQAIAAGKDEAIFVRDGAVTECSSANLFAVLDGQVRTYPVTNYILAGVTRDVMLEVARQLGIPVRETPVLAAELPRADEVFYTSTTNDVMPVVEVDGRPVGSGRPGPVTQRLYSALREHLLANALEPVAE